MASIPWSSRLLRWKRSWRLTSELQELAIGEVALHTLAAGLQGKLAGDCVGVQDQGAEAHIETCNRTQSSEINSRETCVDTKGLTEKQGLQKDLPRGAVNCLTMDWVFCSTNPEIQNTTEASVMPVALSATQQTSLVKDWSELEEKAATADRNPRTAGADS